MSREQLDLLQQRVELHVVQRGQSLQLEPEPPVGQLDRVLLQPLRLQQRVQRRGDHLLRARRRRREVAVPCHDRVFYRY